MVNGMPALQAAIATWASDHNIDLTNKDYLGRLYHWIDKTKPQGASQNLATKQVSALKSFYLSKISHNVSTHNTEQNTRQLLMLVKHSLHTVIAAFALFFIVGTKGRKCGILESHCREILVFGRKFWKMEENFPSCT